MSEGYTIPLPWNRIAGSIVALFALLLLYLAPLNGTSRWIIFLTGTLIGSYQFTREVTGHIFTKKKVTTDVIMTLAIIGAAVLGELEEALTLVFLYSITETLESYTVKRTKVSITSLMKLVPKQILALVDGKEQLVDVELLSVGDTVRIRVGDVIPTDGIIQTGSAAINEATVTGEAIPIFKTVGDGVLAGSHCSDGTFTYEVSKVVGESTVSKIINMVQEAQTKKIPTQLTIERFTKYYNPGIVIFSALVFIIPALITSEVRAWAIIAVTLLVASSPCALAISSPVTMYSAISSAASRGILVKGGVFLEELGRVEAVVFDKTGTLTSGQVVLSDIIPMDGMSRDEVLQLAASLEQHSQHPLARAVLRAHDSELLDVEDHRTQPGVGISGMIDGSEYFFGKWDGDSNLSSEGKSVSYLVRDNVPLATFGFRDEVRDHISVAIQELHAKDIPVFMLTGDNREAAHTIGAELGIVAENIFYAMSPGDKMSKVEELKQDYKLAMVGDGINDAPALALADIGIAMGIAGTDVALETADIAIMSDDLLQLVRSIRIGKRMKSTIVQNIILSTIILVGLLGGVLLGEVNITQAILIHEGTEVLIVANAMKLFFRR